MDQIFRNRLRFCLAECGTFGCISSILKSLYIWLRHRHSFLSVAGNLFIGPGVRIDLGVNSSLSFGGGTELANDVTVICKQEMVFGKNNIVAAGTIIRDTDGHAIHYDGSINPEMTKRIVIGDHVWIGNKALILKGVTIGEGAVIAAGAVVTKDVPPFSLAAGNPARIIREGIRWER
jgi:acetyltransferase-like isoleucine patch superfamily enzyme